ncbi:MAG: CBS domain-containing protein [Candidatus Marsarchaeota archaeon]|nr:CBS domain-containing protein [Candidatus Marsarchaeota archaeon]
MQLPKRSIKVHEIMSRPVVTGRESDSIYAIAEKMKRYSIGSVVIQDARKKPVGIITERDIIRRMLAKKRRDADVAAKEIMSFPLVKINDDATLEEAAALMVKKKVKKLCAIERTGELVGIISESDIIRNANYIIDTLNELLSAGYQGR